MIPYSQTTNSCDSDELGISINLSVNAYKILDSEKLWTVDLMRGKCHR